MAQGKKTQAENSGTKPISAWSWLFSNFIGIMIALFVITPFGMYKSWGSAVIWIPIILFVVIASISVYHGIKQYKWLVKSGHIKKF